MFRSCSEVFGIMLEIVAAHKICGTKLDGAAFA